MTAARPGHQSALLFDLDGTLVHSLPDMAGALNSLLEELTLPALEIEEVRLMNLPDNLKRMSKKYREHVQRLAEAYGVDGVTESVVDAEAAKAKAEREAQEAREAADAEARRIKAEADAEAAKAKAEADEKEAVAKAQAEAAEQRAKAEAEADAIKETASKDA